MQKTINLFRQAKVCLAYSEKMDKKIFDFFINFYLFFAVNDGEE